MLETSISAKIDQLLKRHSWECVRLRATSPCRYPDRMGLKHGITIFIEVKRPGQKASPAQKRNAEKLVKNGFYVGITDNVKTVEALLNWAVQFPHSPKLFENYETKKK